MLANFCLSPQKAFTANFAINLRCRFQSQTDTNFPGLTNHIFPQTSLTKGKHFKNLFSSVWQIWSRRGAAFSSCFLNCAIVNLILDKVPGWVRVLLYPLSFGGSGQGVGASDKPRLKASLKHQWLVPDQDDVVAIQTFFSRKLVLTKSTCWGLQKQPNQKLWGMLTIYWPQGYKSSVRGHPGTAHSLTVQACWPRVLPPLANPAHCHRNECGCDSWSKPHICVCKYNLACCTLLADWT